MDELIDKLRTRFPKLKFTPGRQFYWSPETREIYFDSQATGHQERWSLLHETGHAILDHRSYKADFELLQLELAAWQQARRLGREVGIEIDEDHIQDCLDTYRDWLYKRSICPECGTKCLQQDDHSYYRCFNCRAVWRVSASRFARAYRRQKDVPQAAPFHLATDL